jgi:hypothetical protein
VECRGQRLVDEGDLAEADAMGDVAKHLLRLGIGGIVAIDEAHRPAMDDGAHLLAQEGLGRDLEMAHEHLHDIGQRDLASPQRRGLLDQRRAQDRLQRPEQPAVGLLDISRDGIGAEAHAIAILILEVDGTGNERALALHRRQRRGVSPEHADGRVRGPEIKSAGNHDRPFQAMEGHHI